MVYTGKKGKDLLPNNPVHHLMLEERTLAALERKQAEQASVDIERDIAATKKRIDALKMKIGLPS